MHKTFNHLNHNKLFFIVGVMLCNKLYDLPTYAKLIQTSHSFIYWEINSCYEFNCFCEFIKSFEGKKFLFFIRKKHSCSN